MYTYEDVISTRKEIENAKPAAADQPIIMYIVSLTTYPDRFPTAHEAIWSLLRQRCSYPYEVHLYLSGEEIAKNGGIVPPNIEELTGGGLKIFIRDGNLRSYKKLVYALREHPERTIITADDDVIYPPDLLESLIEKSREYPGCVVCARGHFLSFDSTGRFRPYCEINGTAHGSGRGITPSICLMPTGVGGVLYPPHSLDDIALDDKSFMSLCPHADDIWFKMASLKRGTPCVRTTDQNPPTEPCGRPGAKSLFEINVTMGENDSQFKACFDRYPEALETLTQDFLKNPDYELYDELTKKQTSGAGFYKCMIKYAVYRFLSDTLGKKIYAVKAGKYRGLLDAAGSLKTRKI